MHHYRRTIAVGAILTTALAQSSPENATTVTTLISFGGDLGSLRDGIYASLVDENDDIATLALGCGPDDTAATATALDGDFPDCYLYRDLTITAGASTFHIETGCEPDATICVTFDCTAPASAAAICVGETTAPALFLLSDNELSSLSFDPWTLTGTAAEPYTAVSSTTVTTEIPPESLASMSITITAGAASAAQTTDGSDNNNNDDDSSATATESQSGASSTAGESAAADSTGGSSGAGRLSLGVSGGIAGVFAVVLAAL